jgi:hypothetical protein
VRGPNKNDRQAILPEDVPLAEARVLAKDRCPTMTLSKVEAILDVLTHEPHALFCA